MRLVFFIVSLLIAYGSLYPFQFVMLDGSKLGGLDWLFTLEQRTTRGDILGNVLLFVPFGFFGALCVEQTNKARHFWYTGLLILVGFVYSIFLQVMQLYLPSRIASPMDAWANLAGLLTGVAIVKLLSSRFMARCYQTDKVTSTIAIPLLLCASWLGYHWFPFIPSFNWAQIEFSFRPLTHWHLVSPFLLVDKFIAWSLFWYFFEKLMPREVKVWHRWCLVLVILLGQIILIRNLMSLNTLAAALVSIVVLRYTRQINKGNLAFILLAWLMIRGWYPFSLGEQAQGFSITPFASFVKGMMWINSYVLFENLFYYGASCYFCYRWLLDWRKVSIVMTLWLLTIEVGQIWFSHDSAELTDPLIVLFLSLGFAHLHRGKLNQPNPLVTRL